MNLQVLGALLLPVWGWLMGAAVQARTAAHLAALRQTVQLLQRMGQEIAFRRVDLQQLYGQLCREGLVAPGSASLQALPPPEALAPAEQQCFRECFSGLGYTEAAQECQRLDYYITRFQALLQQAEEAARRQAGLPCRLGLAAGAVLALTIL